MSEYSSYSYDYEPRVPRDEIAQAAGLAAGQALGTAATVGISAGIAALGVAAMGVAALYRAVQDRAQQLEATRLRAPEAWLGAIQSEPLVRAAVEREMPDLTRLQTDGGHLADALPRLQQAIARSRDHLLVAETSVLHGHMTASLAEMGYVIRQPRRTLTDCVIIHATKTDGTAVSLRLTPKAGKVECDFAGFHGNNCVDERVRFEDALRRRGVLLTQQIRQRHGQVAGGALVAQARSAVSNAAAHSMPTVIKHRQRV